MHGTLPYSRLLKRDDQLRALLESIPLPKFIFTNADQKHAETCLDLMGVADLFQVEFLESLESPSHIVFSVPSARRLLYTEMSPVTVGVYAMMHQMSRIDEIRGSGCAGHHLL